MGYALVIMPLLKLVSVSGYNMQEDGADDDLESAFNIAYGLEYVRTAVEVVNLKVDDVAPILTATTTTTTMMKKTNSTKKRDDTDPCDDLCIKLRGGVRT